MNVNQPSSVVAQVIQSLVDAWNRRDATEFANLFSEDAHYIDGDGRWLKGRRDCRPLRRSRRARLGCRGAVGTRLRGNGDNNVPLDEC